MHRWHIQFSQMFNGYVSQSMVDVDAEDIHGALEEFEAIGYVNARVQAVYRHREGRALSRPFYPATNSSCLSVSVSGS